MNTQGPASGWPSATGSSIGIMGESGSNPNPDKDRPSVSPSRREEQTGKYGNILIVEDNSADVFLIRAAIDVAKIDAEFHIARDGERAIRFFDEADGDDGAPVPVLVILDINLPKKNGGEVLRHMRKSRKCGNALVMVVSTSDSARDREEMGKLGANGYFRKPSVWADFMKLGDMIRELLTMGSRPA
jgi:CheY-like chemotaxis protein